MTSSRVADVKPVAPDGTPVQWAMDPVNPVGRARIGKDSLVRARTLLSEARNELAPSQWELLENRLAEAERAYEPFAKVAGASGKAAEVERAAKAPEAGLGAEPSGAGKALARAGPLLALLILLWPAETADRQHDHGPNWISPEEEAFKSALRELSRAARQVEAELVAVHGGPGVKASQRDRPPRPNEVGANPNWKSGQPEDSPCEFRGGGGNGLSLPPGWLRCTYVCGKYLVKLYDVWGESSDACKRPPHLIRAKKEAENFARRKGKGL